MIINTISKSKNKGNKNAGREWLCKLETLGDVDQA